MSRKTTPTASSDTWERIKAQFGNWSLTTYGILGFAFLYVPIVILVIFSFNDARSISKWAGFTTEWYGKMFRDGQIMLSIWNSLFLAIVSTIIATILGTLVALGLERYNFKGKTAVDSMFYLPVIIPDIAMAIMLLLFFNMSGIGFTPWKVTFFGTKLAVPYSVIIGHVAFNTSFVAIVVRARLTQMDRTLEEAANDLYANAWQTFRRITLPMLMPGIIGGALLAFTLSLDDFVITFFTSGAGFNTLPVRVFGMIKKGVTPKINAVSTLMLAVSLTLVVISILLSKRSDDGGSVKMGF
jgi:spermidine/putrescine transport system permease protein